MKPISRRTRRWAVPAAALAAVLGTGAVANLVPAHADTPNLPTLTAAELLAKARTAQVSTLSGTIELTANLGLPSTSALSSSLGGSSAVTLASLVAGTHSADVWMDGPDHLRVATSKPLAETNWVRNGTDLWSYDSATLRTTHATFAPPAVSPTDPSTPADPKPAAAADAATPEKTPAQFAQELLDQVTPSTDVTVDPPTYVNDRPVYELVLSPKIPTSTVRDAVISVDAVTGVPLAVRIDGKTGSNPAFSFGFTKVSFDKPNPSIFEFTAPPGSTIVQAASPSELINPTPTAGERHHRHRKAPPSATDIAPAPAPPAAPTTPGADVASKVTTIGTDWSTVAVLAPDAAPAQVATMFSGAPTVKVGSQNGRLVTTKLFSAILLDDGHLVIGALTPDALVAAAATPAS